jgi:alkanesulfonate monooxygenase SsuD/methylene tetrahydromethanopterin reductase-like flavin-dependent oxidoreductase (luciferase family)
LEVGFFSEMPYKPLEPTAKWPVPRRNYDPIIGSQLYREALQAFYRADELGFRILCINEQHSKPSNVTPSPNLLMADLATHTKQAKLLPYGSILPLHNPLRVAEEYAMLDVLSKGRLMAGFIRGGASNHLAYSIPSRETRGRYEEAWELIIRAWTAEEPFPWRGKYFQFDIVNVWPRTYQNPHPPIWSSGLTDRSIEWAALKGAGYTRWLSVTAASKLLLDKYRFYHRKYHDGADPQASQLGVARSVYVSKDGDAKAECEEHYLHFKDHVNTQIESPYRRIPEGGKIYMTGKILGAGKFSHEVAKRGGLHICGTPAEVVQEILAQKKALGFGVFLANLNYGNMPQRKAMRNLETFAREVMPELEEA